MLINVGVLATSSSILPPAPSVLSELFVDGRLEAGRLFEDIQERSQAIHSIAFRIAYPFYDTRPF
jgi:hypothetical protein